MVPFQSAIVSILTQSYDRVQPVSGCQLATIHDGFNPHPVLRPGATGGPRGRQTGRRVSILTQSYDRVQLSRCARYPPRMAVSILTQSYDRVQPAGREVVRQAVAFQSSPSLTTGCNKVAENPKTGQKEVSILTQSYDRVQPVQTGRYRFDLEFQSSPSLTTGCNACTTTPPSKGTGFNPHPVLRPGATSWAGHPTTV